MVGIDDLYRTTEWTADVKAGVALAFDGVGADGAPSTVGGEYLELDPPKKIVQTWVAPWTEAT